MKEYQIGLDFTCLYSHLDYKNVGLFCEQALQFSSDRVSIPAVCVWGTDFGRVHALFLEAKSPIQVGVVAGGFPHGNIPCQSKMEEVRFVTSLGAQEVDVPLYIPSVLCGAYDFVEKEVEDLKSATGGKTLKVILETGVLTKEQVRLASRAAIRGGADFLKTSTGTLKPGATLEAFDEMLYEVKAAFEGWGKKVGLKPSGGIRTYDVACHYAERVHDVLGSEWLTDNLFRVGSSTLLP